jgi:hypothetical protein
MDRERAKSEIQKQQLENTPESRMRRLEQQMREVLEENARLRNGGHKSDHDEANH